MDAELDPCVEPRPAHCPACGAKWGPYKLLVGRDNLHDPPCRTWICRTCDHTTYATDWPVWQRWEKLVADASRS